MQRVQHLFFFLIGVSTSSWRTTGKWAELPPSSLCRNRRVDILKRANFDTRPDPSCSISFFILSGDDVLWSSNPTLFRRASVLTLAHFDLSELLKLVIRPVWPTPSSLHPSRRCIDGSFETPPQITATSFLLAAIQQTRLNSLSLRQRFRLRGQPEGKAGAGIRGL